MRYKIDFTQFEKEYLDLRTKGKSHEDALKILTEKYGRKDDENKG